MASQVPQIVPTLNPPRAENARALLGFARRGADAMRKSPGAEWIVLLAGTLALLRGAVAVPLKDGDRRIVAAQRRRWKEIDADKAAHSVFFDFIKKQRDDVIHHAALGASQHATAGMDFVSNFYRIEAGYGVGKEFMSVIEEAIVWTEQFIDTIEGYAVGMDEAGA